MTTYPTNRGKQMSLPKVLALVFMPSILLTAMYVIVGRLNQTIPSLLLFYVLAVLILFPIEIGVVLKASQKEYGRYALKSAETGPHKMSWWKTFIYGASLFAFAGIMSVTIAPLENSLFAPISSELTQSMPAYFDWNNIESFKQYPKDILLLTFIGYFILNVFVGPIIEELFFRGYLTAKVSRYGKLAPLMITVLFSLYHLWLPFHNLFRIAIFFPAAWLAWRKKNIYISIVFHCLSNLFATISLIISVYAG